MTRNTPIHFSWSASENLDDPSGIAVFKCNDLTVNTHLGDFTTASKLSNLLHAAYQLGINDAIDRAMKAVPDLLNKQRYE